MGKLTYIERKLTNNNEDGGRKGPRRATYWPSETDELQVQLVAESCEEFLKLRIIPDHNILRPMTIVKSFGKSDIAFENTLWSVSELVLEKNVLFSDPQANSSKTMKFRKFFFDSGNVISSLHKYGFYHGNLHEKNTYVDKEYNVKLSGLLGLSNYGNILVFENMKNADWHDLAVMTEWVFSRHKRAIPLVLADLLSCMKAPRGLRHPEEKPRIFFGHPFWWSIGHKRTIALEADLTWDLVHLDSTELSWPKELKDYLTMLNISPHEKKYNYLPKISSFVRWLANKLIHPEFHGLFPFPNVEGDAEMLIHHLEKIWPWMWLDLLKHKYVNHH